MECLITTFALKTVADYEGVGTASSNAYSQFALPLFLF
jgi:hypothetical protein